MINGENQKASEGVGMEMVSAEKPKTAEKCGATICFGDDFMDNTCTFHCGLDKGHTGRHVETGDMGMAMSYRLEWDGDAREEENDGKDE